MCLSLIGQALQIGIQRRKVGLETKPGHRERLRMRFLDGEAGSQNDDALLELLLTYAIPQCDVQEKPLAARASSKFIVDSGGAFDLCLNALFERLGLAVCGDHGAILRFEMQATKGSGRIVPLGSIQKVMRESIEAAAQYVKAKHEELGVTAEWRQSFDVAFLATFMGVPKEGPSAGIALAVGIISALKGLPVRNDLAMKEVVIPKDNLAEAQALPAAIVQKLKITTVQAVDEAIKAALIAPKA